MRTHVAEVLAREEKKTLKKMVKAAMKNPAYAARVKIIQSNTSMGYV
jgi:hypothetical protein